MGKKNKTPELPPIFVSPAARQVLTNKMREWTGWARGTLMFGQPRTSPFAECDHATHTITVDPEQVILNPNRVLLTVTPFRLRQEAVLTGCLLHEAGHARFTHWKPRTVEELTTKPLLHSDGAVPTQQTVALAMLMEEPRIEGRMAAQADNIGALGLGWTMRASAAHLLPPTEMSENWAQQVMDVITSWALRAGRQVSLNYNIGTAYRVPSWVHDFTSLLHMALEMHFVNLMDQGADLSDSSNDPRAAAHEVQRLLKTMIVTDDDTGPTMIDIARDLLALLFPETGNPETDQQAGEAMPGAGCSSPSESGDGESGDEEGETGEGNTEPEDEGSGDDPGAGDSGGDEDGEGEADGDGEGEPEESEGEGASASTEPQVNEQIAATLAALEAQCKEKAEAEAEAEAEKAPPLEGSGSGAGAGAGGALGGSWRTPTAEQRDVQRGAGTFLRNLLDASESSVRSLTDQPSASVDGAALSAWKAGGQVRDPHFFIRTRRQVEPSPPIKIAILVDVSASMDELQEPSALLSWSLASAALDLRNFAGRGQQVESCLIHWGDSVRVMQKPGEVLPGIRHAACNQGTSAMHEALDEVENLMPGFFDVTEQPVNRLLVQFTDWRLHGRCIEPTRDRLDKALGSGVNMLSVVPGSYSARWGNLNDILSAIPIQRGQSRLVKYNEGRPGQVWSTAANVLADRGEISSPEPEGASLFPTTY